MMLACMIVLTCVIGALMLLGGVLFLIKWFQSPSKADRIREEQKLVNAYAKAEATKLRRLERELKVDVLTPSEYLDSQNNLEYDRYDFDYDRHFKRKVR